MGCVFCSIARGEEPAYYVYKDSDLMAILDIYPVEKGHLLVIPREHYEAVHNTPPRLVAKVFVAAAGFARIYRETLGAPGVNVLTNSGSVAGQVIFHFHVHVIPRWGRRRGSSFFGGRHVLSEEEAEEVISMLRPHVWIVERMLEEAGLR